MANLTEIRKVVGVIALPTAFLITSIGLPLAPLEAKIPTAIIALGLWGIGIACLTPFLKNDQTSNNNINK